MPNTEEDQCVRSDRRFCGRPNLLWRRSMNSLVTLAAVGAVVLVLLPLGAVFGYLIYKGIGSINWAFLTQIPKPPGEAGGGMANAIAGSVYILLIASVMGVPAGNRRWNLSLGVRTRNSLRQPDPLHRGCAQRRALDHRGHRGLRPGRTRARDTSRRWPAASLSPS